MQAVFDPRVTPNDRLTMTLFLAGVLHAVVILGVNFAPPEPSRIQQSLEIALVSRPTEEAPVEAEFLAQANQLGSGESELQEKPKPQKIPLSGQQAQTSSETTVHEVEPDKTKTNQALLQMDARQAIDKAAVDEVIPEAPVEPRVTVKGLAEQIAQLGRDLTLQRQSYAKRPKFMYINSVRASLYVAAAYEQGWQDKIERVGNLNYPDEARRRNLSGTLVLAVGINKDGTIYKIDVRRSSGHQVLDDAAKRIVRLSAPFAAFPKKLAEQADILVITRTWKFTDNHMETSF